MSACVGIISSLGHIIPSSSQSLESCEAVNVALPLLLLLRLSLRNRIKPSELLLSPFSQTTQLLPLCLCVKVTSDVPVQTTEYSITSCFRSATLQHFKALRK